MDHSPRHAPHSVWRDALYSRLRGQAEPLFVFPDCTIPAASLWVAARLWVDLFRSHQLRPGDRVLLAREPGAGSLAFLVAALWEGLSIAVALPYTGGVERAEFFDARLGLGCDGLDADAAGCPVLAPQWSTRVALHAPTPLTRFITRTSGTGGSPRWVALSDRNVWSVLESHRPFLCQQDDVVLSILPWHHSFGLFIDVLPTLLGASMLVREPSGGRDAASVIDAASAWGATWCSMVPLQAARLAESATGVAFLRGLRGGVIGGAAATASLCATLRTTSLRVGYGQTEASPGICLGDPGAWEAGYIGRPVGCEARVTPESRLQVRGPNVCAGFWQDGAVRRLSADRWLDTGDLVGIDARGYTYFGRADHSFKLDNGRLVDAGIIEAELRGALPGLEDAALYSPDGARLGLCLVMAPGAMTPDVAIVSRVLGPLSARLETLSIRTDDHTFRTPKGSLDRAKLLIA